MPDLEHRSIKPFPDLPTHPRPDGYLPVCRVVDVPKDRAKVVDLLDQRIALYRTGDQIHAVNEVCPHKMGPLGEGRVKDGCVVCPWHGWEFSLITGQSVTLHNVPVYDVKILDGEIFVSIKPKKDYRDFAPPRAPIVERTWYGEPREIETRVAAALYRGMRWLAGRGLPLVDAEFRAAEALLPESDAIAELGLEPKMRVIDIGCGGGATTCLAAQGGASVIGTALTDEELAAARKRIGLEKPKGRVSIQKADVLRLPYPNNSFHAVLAFNVLGYVPRRTRALREIARVLKPGGRAALIDLVHERGDRIALAAAGLLRPWSAAQYNSAFEAAGLQISREEDLTAHLPARISASTDSSNPLLSRLSRVASEGLQSLRYVRWQLERRI